MVLTRFTGSGSRNLVEIAKELVNDPASNRWDNAPHGYKNIIPDKSFNETIFDNFYASNVYFDIGRWDEVIFTDGEIENCLFFGSQLFMSEFSAIDISDTHFDSSALSGAKFRSCNFRNTIFFGCSLVDVLFEECVFKNVVFSDNNLKAGCDLDGVVFKECEIDSNTNRSISLTTRDQ